MASDRITDDLRRVSVASDPVSPHSEVADSDVHQSAAPSQHASRTHHGSAGSSGAKTYTDALADGIPSDGFRGSHLVRGDSYTASSQKGRDPDGLLPSDLTDPLHARRSHKKQKVSDTREKHGKARRSRPTGMEDAASPMAASTSMDQPLSDNDTEPQMILHLRGYIPDPWDKRDPGHGKGYWFKETWTHLPTCKCFSCKPRRPSELRHSATTKPSGRSSTETPEHRARSLKGRIPAAGKRPPLNLAPRLGPTGRNAAVSATAPRLGPLAYEQEEARETMYEEKPAVFFSQPSVDAAYRYGLSRGQPPPYSYGQPQMQSPQNSYGQIQLQPPQNSYGQIQLQPPQNSYGQIQLQPPQNSYGPTHMQPPQTPYGPTHMQPPQPPYGPTHMQPPRIFYGEAQMPPPQYPYDQTQMQPRRYSHDQTQMPPSQYLYDQTQMQPRRYSYDQAQMPPRQYSYDQLQSLAPSSIQTVPTFAPSRRASRRSISSTQHLAGPPAPGLTQLLAPPPNSAAGFPQTGPQINPQAFDASLASPTSAILDDDLLLPQFAQAPVRHAAHGYTHAPGLTSAARTAYTSDAAHVPSPAGPQYVPGRVATDPYQWPEHQWPLPTPDQMHAALNELDWRGTPARLLAASFAGVVRRGTKAQFLAMITEMGGAYLDDVDMVFNLQ